MKKTALVLTFVSLILVLIVQVACAEYYVLSAGPLYITVSSPSPTGTLSPIPTVTVSPIPTPPPDIPTPSPTPSFIPVPSVPEFSLRLVPSFPEENKTTIELMIENQPFDKENIYHYSFVYNVRIRTADEDWTDLYNAEDGYPYQSDTEQTALSYVSGEIAYYPRADYPAAPSKKVGILPISGKVDFQVEAMIGYRTRSWEPPMLPYVFEGERSGWSDTQTITISDPSAPSPIPTSTSFSPDLYLMVVSIAVSVATVCVVSLVYFRKRRGEAKLS